LLENVVQRSDCHVLAWISGDRHHTGFRCMPVLMMAAFGSDPIPTVSLKELHKVAHLHAITINLSLQGVNVLPRPTAEFTRARGSEPMSSIKVDDKHAFAPRVQRFVGCVHVRARHLRKSDSMVYPSKSH
jgi:hypothetical protein